MNPGEVELEAKQFAAALDLYERRGDTIMISSISCTWGEFLLELDSTLATLAAHVYHRERNELDGKRLDLRGM